MIGVVWQDTKGTRTTKLKPAGPNLGADELAPDIAWGSMLVTWMGCPSSPGHTSLARSAAALATLDGTMPLVLVTTKGAVGTVAGAEMARNSHTPLSLAMRRRATTSKWCTPQMTPAAKNDLKSFTMFTSLKWSASMAGVVWEDRNGARTTDTKPWMGCPNSPGHTSTARSAAALATSDGTLPLVLVMTKGAVGTAAGAEMARNSATPLSLAMRWHATTSKWCTPQMTLAAKNDLKSFTMFTSLKLSAPMTRVVWQDRKGTRTTETKPAGPNLGADELAPDMAWGSILVTVHHSMEQPNQMPTVQSTFSLLRNYLQKTLQNHVCYQLVRPVLLSLNNHCYLLMTDL
jgi:hypothetical protein